MVNVSQRLDTSVKRHIIHDIYITLKNITLKKEIISLRYCNGYIFIQLIIDIFNLDLIYLGAPAQSNAYLEWISSPCLAPVQSL